MDPDEQEPCAPPPEAPAEPPTEPPAEPPTEPVETAWDPPANKRASLKRFLLSTGSKRSSLTHALLAKFRGTHADGTNAADAL